MYKRLIIILIIILALAAVLIYGMSRNPNRRDDINSNVKLATSFTAPVFERYQVEYGQELGVMESFDKPLLINFWASWCGPCYQEAPALEKAWQKYQDQILFIGVNTQDKNFDDAQEFLDNFKVSYPNVRDEKNRIGIDYAIFGLPETFFIRKDLSISSVFKGPVTEDILEKELAKLLP